MYGSVQYMEMIRYICLIVFPATHLATLLLLLKKWMLPEEERKEMVVLAMVRLTVMVK